MRYVIGTGWWCERELGTPEGTAENGHSQIGDQIIRSRQFFELWMYFVRRYTSPLKIIVTDSASPIPPPVIVSSCEYIRLDRNYHSVKGTNRNGWLRGFVMGAWYAWNCDADYIYIEQDCLVVGKDWVSALYAVSEDKYLLFGCKFRGPIQQSLVFIPHCYIPGFLHALSLLTCHDMTCEMRFHEAIKRNSKLAYTVLPFGVGRARPIYWGSKHLYAQHWTREELVQLSVREGIIGKIETLLSKT